MNDSKIQIKILLNISYNYHRLSENDKALVYANKGIFLCKQNETLYLLPHLLFRKRIALYHLQEKNYKVSLKESIYIFKFLGNVQLATIYTESLMKNYSINLQV